MGRPIARRLVLQQIDNSFNSAPLIKMVATTQSLAPLQWKNFGNARQFVKAAQDAATETTEAACMIQSAAMHAVESIRNAGTPNIAKARVAMDLKQHDQHQGEQQRQQQHQLHQQMPMKWQLTPEMMNQPWSTVLLTLQACK